MSPIVTIGNICIGASFGLSLFGIVSFFIGRKVESSVAASLGRGAVYGNFILMTIASLAMVNALLGNDFGVSYVAHVGSRETPRWVSAISLWSSLEGSILFWGWILSAYAAVCIYLYRERDATIMNWVGLTLLAVEFFFFLLLALPANPFLPVSPIPANGPGPNPLLQNHWLMTIHPPCLYLGYIGFTIPFAFATAALLEPPSPLAEEGSANRSANWISMARPWILFAWSFLSMAIVLGGWWSYAVLGWGGYWAWDPVENASFMPWLTGTALLHSMIVQEKRKILPVWNLMLALLTFLLTLLGTFLTRSGVLDSVHSFTESHIGPYFLVFIGIVLGVSLALLLWQGPKFRESGKIENLFSLEVLFLFNNLLFLSFCFVVFLGTLYPLVVEAIQGKRISVGEPYFNQMTVPIVGMILLLMGIGLITPWKQGRRRLFFQSARLPALLSLLPGLVSIFLGGSDPLVVMVVYLSSFAFFIMLREVIVMGRRRGIKMILENPRRYCGFIAHTGALMIIIAVTLSSRYLYDHEVTLKPGESVEAQGYQLTFEEMRAEDLPHRYEIKAVMGAQKAGSKLSPLTPQMNYYPNSKEPIGSPAVRSTLIEDLYLTLIHFEKDGSAASFRVIVRPAVAWIWIGGVVVMMGGLLSVVLGKRSYPS